MLKITNKMVKVHSDFYDFNPRWKLESAEYEKATIKSIDEKPKRSIRGNNNNNKQEVIRRAGDLAEPLEHWARIAPVEETTYYTFLDKITDSKQDKFYPGRDRPNMTPVKGTGAMHVITDIIRLKTGDIDSLEFLLSKGYIIGHDASGEEVYHYLPFPERWFKTLFGWSNEYNNSSKQFERICLGPSGAETVYLLPFNKENAKALFDRRANDLINFVVKDEISNEAKRVEPDVNSLKTFERFMQPFDYLWSGEYIPAPIRQELRQEAVARGYIKGGSADYQVTATQSKADKNAYG